MPFIKTQKIVRDACGEIISGSASLADTIYLSTKSRIHSKHVIRERLGKVLSLSVDRRSGVFLSPTRGLVEYNATTDSFASVDRNDARISGGEVFPEPAVHTVFGDSYLLLMFLEKRGLLSVLRAVFPPKRGI